MNNEIIYKLNEKENFHLNLKSIQINDKEVLKMVYDELINNGLSAKVIDSSSNIYDQLLKAYTNNIDYVLIDENINFMLPLVIGLYENTIDFIKPVSIVVYSIKDNRIVNQLTRNCNNIGASLFKANKDFLINDKEKNAKANLANDIVNLILNYK